MKKGNILLSVGIILICFFIGVCLFDFFYEKVSKNVELLFKIVEILSASGVALTLSISFNITINNKNSALIKLDETIESEIAQNTGDGNININKSTVYNDPKSTIMVMRETYSMLQKENIENIVNKVCEKLGNTSQNQLLSKDFVLKYLNEASNICDSDIQDIWVNLLIQENKQSSSVSKRTLDIVKNLSSSEAKLFQNVAGYSMSDGIILKKQLEKYVSFIDISKLQDIGFLKSNDFIQRTYKINPNGENNFVESSIIMKMINNSNIMQDVVLDCYMLTSEGLELKNALNIMMSTNNIIEFGKTVKSQLQANSNVSIYAHQIVSINGNKVNHQTNDLL